MQKEKRRRRGIEIMFTKIKLEKFFEKKYTWIENHIRETKGDTAYDIFLDALVDLQHKKE